MAETVPMRAYVTSGDPLVTTRAGAPCVRATASRVASRARWLAVHERREGLAQHAPPIGGNLRVGLRGMRRRLRFPAGVPPTVTTLKAAGGATVQSADKDARVKRAAHGHRAAPATLRLHQAYRSRVKRRTGTPLQTPLASTTGATRQRCSVSLEEPGGHVWLEHRATPRRMSPDGPFRGRPTTIPPSRGRRNFSPTVSGTAIATLFSVSRRPRSHATHCALLTRHALTARTKQYGLTSRSTGPKTCALWILALLQRGQLTCLPFAPATGDQDGKLPAQSEDDDPAVSDGRPVEMVEQEGGFRHQHTAPWSLQSTRVANPKSPAKRMA